MHLRIGILTISDRVSRGVTEDTGALAIETALSNPEWDIAARAVVPDDVATISNVLRGWADDERLDIAFTTGGTGLSPTDVTPEATLEVVHRLVPGVAEAIRSAGLQQTEQAMLSRALVGVRGTTLIVNLPGSPKGAAQGTEVVRPVLEHAVAIMQGGRH